MGGPLLLFCVGIGGLLVLSLSPDTNRHFLYGTRWFVMALIHDCLALTRVAVSVDMGGFGD